MARPARNGLRIFMEYWLPVLVYVTAIIVVSAQPRLRPPLAFQNADKLYHVLEYMGLGFVLVRAIRVSFARRAMVASVVALAAGFAIAVGDELFQATVPGRNSSHLDVMADLAGLVLAQMLYQWFARPDDTYGAA